MYEAANLFRDRCLVEGGSFLWPEHHVWTPETITALLDAFTGENAIEGQGTFFEKWRRQLAEQPEAVHRVAADIIAFYYLFPLNIGRDKKLADVRMVSGWKLAHDLPNLGFLERAYSASVGHAGMLYSTGRPWQVIFYLEFVRDLLSKGLEPTDRDVCKHLADHVKSRLKSSNPARNILLHLLFPFRFERIASDSFKQKIVGAFHDKSGGVEDIDDALENIRSSLVKEYGENFDFYDENIMWQWENWPKPLNGFDPKPGTEVVKMQITDHGPLNAILYGPPGTGKTYSTQRRAIEIIEPSPGSRLSSEKVGEKFREYREQERIEFVTFHPSYSYEEFVEGFRYDEDKKVPVLNSGIFEEICRRAEGSDEAGVEVGGRVWKVSLGERHGEPGIFERCMEKGEIAVGWLHGIDLTGANSERVSELFREHHPGSKAQATNRLVNEMREGDYVAIYDSPKTIRAIGVVTGGYKYKGDEDDYHHTRPVKWLDKQVREIWDLNGNTNLTMETIYELWRITPSKLTTLLPDSPVSNNEEPYVLVIDEINRGNISRIFGELITLLEPDKRLGAPNELSVRLPYSKKTFAVPSNLYIIGTMNTADRSIALLDVALRRRFEFEKMMPDVEIVRGALREKVEAANSELSAGQVEMICSVFTILNARITALLDRDHQIGHSYFLGIASMQDLHDTLYRRVFPLLQEYFYNDPERLERLLGVYNENEHSGFIGQTAGEYGKGFKLDDEVDERPWSFHEYEAEKLEAALRNTFLNE